MNKRAQLNNVDICLTIEVIHICFVLIFFKKFGKRKLLLITVTLMTILQMSHVRFEPCPSRLQSQVLTVEPTPTPLDHCLLLI
jgi:hypothetical protein